MSSLSTLKMEPNYFQKPENVATNMPTSKVPAEIGNDAAFPLAGAGAGDTSRAAPEDEAPDAFGDGEAFGETTLATKKQ